MNKRQYINEILSWSCLPYEQRKRIRQDLDEEISTALNRGETMKQIQERMGSPDSIGAELLENYVGAISPQRPFIEYKSKISIMGVPLVHMVRFNRRYYQTIVQNNVFGRVKVPTAKGIIAIGQRAKGIIAIGNFCCGIVVFANLGIGLFSIGNVVFGLLTLCNLGIGLFAAVGNGVISAISFGNVAVGYSAIGNCVLGNVAIGNRGYGKYLLLFDNNSIGLGEIVSSLRTAQIPLFIERIIINAWTFINSDRFITYLIIFILAMVVIATLITTLFFIYTRPGRQDKHLT